MAALLSRNEDGTPNFECKTLTARVGGPSDVVTRTKLKQALEELLRPKADVALFHFSGHGTENDLGGYLVTQDAVRYDEGLAMTDVLRMANDSRADEVVIFLDCCHSGHLGQVPVINNQNSMLREGVSILTASRGDQPSVETAGGGLFTSLVVDALSGGAADLLGDVSAPSVYATVEAALGAWDQRPLFKSHVAKVVSLRRCDPPISSLILRELPDLFPVPAEDLPLTPGFEESYVDKDEAKVRVFAKLQALNRVHLVVPVGTKHMFDAAMQSRACRLTPAGRYYWRLAKSGRI
jgi:hypothetical protein